MIQIRRRLFSERNGYCPLWFYSWTERIVKLPLPFGYILIIWTNK